MYGMVVGVELVTINVLAVNGITEMVFIHGVIIGYTLGPINIYNNEFR